MRSYWEARPCGSSLAEAEPGTREFYDQVELERYRREPFISEFAEFDTWADRRVLEVGVGLGTDFLQFARAGAVVTGVDLTDAAIQLVERRLEFEARSADLCVADAEALPFEPDVYDLVYSWGVLHHTPRPDRAIAEVHRVLRPGGEARIMLYSRRSWVAYGLWLRYALAIGRPWLSLSDVIAAHMESPGTKAYTSQELRTLFGQFASVELCRYVTPYDRRVAGPLTRLGGPRLGWFVGIRAVK